MINSLSPLQQIELFRALSQEELSGLAPLCSDYAVVQDGALFTEGRRASHLYLVTEGQIALQKSIRGPHARSPRRTTIAVCRPGDLVGWSALVEPYKYTLSAVAWEPSRLIRIEADALRNALNANPEMGYKVMRSLSRAMGRRLRQATFGLIEEQELAMARL